MPSVRIALKRLTFDGVGPFRQEEVFELPGDGVTYVYAPNGHGKTSTIDLVRWLIRGPLAVEKDEFRSLMSEQEKNVINHHRFRNMEGGRAEAILEVEGKGTYRVERRIDWSTSPESELTVEEQVDDGWSEIDRPDVFLSSLLPHERLGFNLLTGEHVKEFVDELSGPVVKRSVERLLQNPELVSLHDCLKEIVDELEKEAAAEDRAKRRRLKLLDKRSELQERYKNFQKAVREKENTEHELQEKIEALNQDLAKLDQVEAMAEEKEELEASISDLRQREAREVQAVAKLMSPSWRQLLAVAGAEPVQAFMTGYDEAVEARQVWQEDMGEVRYLERLQTEDHCYCGRPMDDKHRDEIQARIDELEDAEPEVPELPADEWTLRAWAKGSSTDELVGTLETHHQRLAEIRSDLADKTERLDEVESTLAGTDPDEAKRIQRKLKAHKMKINAIRDKKGQDVRNQLDAQEQLNKVKEKLANTDADPVDGPLLSKARSYNDAIRATIDGALPRLRQELLDQVQVIFDKLFQKETQYQIVLGEDSMIPYVAREIDGEEEQVLLSEGEKTRLGLSLLFALRDVASERPFLLLDAPFSTLDDEGVFRLLELVRDHEGQVVVFTKDAFPDGRWYDAVKDADPTVYRMDWVKEDPRDHEGYTEINPAKVGALRLQGD